MDIIVIILAGVLFFYLLALLWLARQIHKMPTPSPLTRCVRYIRFVHHLRSSLITVLFLTGSHALLFLLPTLVTSGHTQQAASLFGLSDLVGAILFYLMWKWAAWLARQAAGRVRVNDQGQPY